MSSSYARRAVRWTGAVFLALAAAYQESATLVAPSGSSTARAAGEAIGRTIADTRTARQDSIAKFWALGPGTVSTTPRPGSTWDAGLPRGRSRTTSSGTGHSC